MMVENKRRCLAALEALACDDPGTFGEASFFPFAPIIRLASLPRPEVRRQVRALARAGLAEFAQGLCTEDGDFAGSGYRITQTGTYTLLFIEAEKRAHG